MRAYESMTRRVFIARRTVKRTKEREFSRLHSHVSSRTFRGEHRPTLPDHFRARELKLSAHFSENGDAKRLRKTLLLLPKKPRQPVPGVDETSPSSASIRGRRANQPACEADSNLHCQLGWDFPIGCHSPPVTESPAISHGKRTRAKK